VTINHTRDGYDPVLRLVELRLAVSAARARIAQAQIVAYAPHVGPAKGVTVEALLADAADALDAVLTTNP
jgi:hypothetical protein